MQYTFERLHADYIGREAKFREYVGKIATRYSEIPDVQAEKFFCKEYNITKSCYHRILEYAVITGSVSNNTVDKMENKACLNARAHSGKDNRVQEHYVQLRKERIEFRKYPFFKRDEKDIATFYAQGQGSAEIAKSYGCTVKQIKLVLYKVCTTKGIISDQLFKMIKNRSLEEAEEEARKKREEQFKQYEKMRKK